VWVREGRDGGREFRQNQHLVWVFPNLPNLPLTSRLSDGSDLESDREKNSIRVNSYISQVPAENVSHFHSNGTYELSVTCSAHPTEEIFDLKNLFDLSLPQRVVSGAGNHKMGRRRMGRLDFSQISKFPL